MLLSKVHFYSEPKAHATRCDTALSLASNTYIVSTARGNRMCPPWVQEVFQAQDINLPEPLQYCRVRQPSPAQPDRACAAAPELGHGTEGSDRLEFTCVHLLSALLHYTSVQLQNKWEGSPWREQRWQQSQPQFQAELSSIRSVKYLRN